MGLGPLDNPAAMEQFPRLLTEARFPSLSDNIPDSQGIERKGSPGYILFAFDSENRKIDVLVVKGVFRGQFRIISNYQRADRECSGHSIFNSRHSYGRCHLMQSIRRDILGEPSHRAEKMMGCYDISRIFLIGP